MPETLLSAAVLIHLGAMFYIIGFLVRDELLLRLLVLAGTTLYICYYFLFPDTPLWDAIITSLILTAANLWVLVKIIYERTTFALSDEEKNLCSAFNTLTPGQFRQVLKHANWHTAGDEEILCQEGRQAERLFYLIDGKTTIKKGDKSFSADESSFLGEISFVLESTYSATVVAGSGARYVSWSAQDLKKQMTKNQAFNNALIALFNVDLAKKLAVSHQ